MPRSPSIVPEDDNRDVYLVLDDFGDLGRAWCETAETAAERTTLIRHLMEGQYGNPVRVVAFNKTGSVCRAAGLLGIASVSLSRWLDRRVRPTRRALQAKNP